MPIVTDFHSHVARSSAAQMVQAAKGKGLHVLGLSEHVFQMSEVRASLEYMQLEGPLLTLATYFDSTHRAAQDFQFDTQVGLELDYVPARNEEIIASIEGYDWDFLIGSVHEIDGVVYEYVHRWSSVEGDAAWLRYFELLRAAASSGHFSTISHPVRMRLRNPYLPTSFDEELEKLAAEATRWNVALEVNGFDVLNYPGVVRRLVKACVLQKTPISVGSDAHDPRGVAQGHQQTEAILREAGITKVRIWKRREIEEYTI